MNNKNKSEWYLKAKKEKNSFEMQHFILKRTVI